MLRRRLRAPAARFLVEQQRSSGDWDQEGITGVFNRNCGITYTAYRNVFPIWALGKYDKYLKAKNGAGGEEETET